MPNDLNQTQVSVVASQPLDQLKRGGAKIKRKKTRDYHELHPVVNTIFSVLLGIFTIMCVFPFIYVIIISLTSEESIVRNGFQIIRRNGVPMLIVTYGMSRINCSVLMV